MKLTTALLAGAIAAAGIGAAAPAEAARHFHGWYGHDIHTFHGRDFGVWRGGGWRHTWHDGHLGWWWVVGPSWYFYSAPIYPYPDPYVPYTVVQQAPPQGGPPPTQSWYYCDDPQGYYPYVSSCRTQWRAVPATPPPG
jgi:hypothetical protein